MITNVMPTLTTPITEASRRIVSTLSMSANRSPAVIDADDAEDRQGDDQAEVAADRAGHEARPRCPTAPFGAAAPSPVVVVALSLMPRPLRAALLRRGARVWPRALHDQVEHPVLVERVGRRLGDDGAVGDDQHAVGQAQHLRDLAGDHDDGDARGRRGRGPARRSPSGRRRRRRGSARRAAAPCSRAAASGPARPSAGCRPTGCATIARRRRPGGRRATRYCSRAAARSAPPDRKPPRANRPRLEMRDVAVDGVVEEQRLALALLGGEADAGGHRGADVARRAAACRRAGPCRPVARRAP